MLEAFQQLTAQVPTRIAHPMKPIQGIVLDDFYGGLTDLRVSCETLLQVPSVAPYHFLTCVLNRIVQGWTDHLRLFCVYRVSD